MCKVKLGYTKLTKKKQEIKHQNGSRTTVFLETS